MTAQDADRLRPVLAETEAMIAGVKPDQMALPTPCPDYTVSQLVDHLTGWADNFAARVSGKEPANDPSQHRAGDDPAGEFRASAQAIVDRYRAGGASDQLPSGIVLMEFLTHGWDLATATNQPVDFPDDAVDIALTTGKHMLSPDFRGPDKSFGPEQQAPASASSLENLVAFLGRDPAWKAPN